VRTSKENLKSRTILTDPGGQWNGRPRERSRTGPPVGLNKEGLSGYDGAWLTGGDLRPPTSVVAVAWYARWALTGGDLRPPTSVVAVAWYAWWVVDWWLTVGGRIQVHQPASLRSLGTAWWDYVFGNTTSLRSVCFLRYGSSNRSTGA